MQAQAQYDTRSFNPFGYSSGGASYDPKHISRSIAPIQFMRLKTDIGDWRDAMTEMEYAYYPQRVKSNRIYIDVQEQIFIKSLVQRMQELVLERSPEIYKIQREGTGGTAKKVISRDLTQAINENYWFSEYRKFVIDAILWGYRNIELGDIDTRDPNNIFPNISFTRNENIRIDNWKGALLTSVIYYIDGIMLQNPDIDEVSLWNHFIPTKSNRGVSDVGYGLYYNIAEYAIHLRHIIGWNMDYTENYGNPTRVGYTNKQGNQRKKFESFLANATSNQYILLDLGTQDKIEYQMASGGGQGTSWKSYENIERRLEYKLSQMVLGHGDAIISMPGKLGGNQTSNKDGFNESLIEQAINSKQTLYSNFEIRSINCISAQKFRDLGKRVGYKPLSNLFPEGYIYGLTNNKEDQEVKRRDNSDKQGVADYALKMFNAGWRLDQEWVSDRFGAKLEYHVPEKKLDETRNNKTTIDSLDKPNAKPGDKVEK